MNLPAAAGLSEVTKAKLWFIAFKASQTSHWRFLSVTKQRRKLPCIDKWSKRTGRILAEYYLRIQYIRPLGSGTTPGLHLSTSLDLHFHFHLFPHPMCADAVMWVTLPVSYFHLRLFCLGGGGGRVRCFCVVTCEGSCINPFWYVRGPRLFSQKNF